MPLNLDFVATLINFGALIAFSMVNLSVIVWFAGRKGLRTTPQQIFTNIVLPLIGLAFTVMLWVNLSPDSLHYGLVWLAIGIIVLIGITRFFRRPLLISMEEEPDALAPDLTKP